MLQEIFCQITPPARFIEETGLLSLIESEGGPEPSSEKLLELRGKIASGWPSCFTLGQKIRQFLDGSSGVVVVRNFPFPIESDRWDIMYLALAVCVALPLPHQDDGSHILWPIKPQIQSRPFETYSETRDEAPLHTDGVYKKRVPDYFSLLMIQASSQGGVLFCLDGVEFCRKLYQSSEGALCLEVMQRLFPIVVPSAYQQQEGCLEVLRRSLLTTEPFQLRFRPDVIAAGLETLQPEDPDTALLQGAFDYFHQALLTETPIRISLGTGDMIFVNNRNVLHGRDAFHGPRELTRIWMCNE